MPPEPSQERTAPVPALDSDRTPSEGRPRSPYRPGSAAAAHEALDVALRPASGAVPGDPVEVDLAELHSALRASGASLRVRRQAPEPELHPPGRASRSVAGATDGCRQAERQLYTDDAERNAERAAPRQERTSERLASPTPKPAEQIAAERQLVGAHNELDRVSIPRAIPRSINGDALDLPERVAVLAERYQARFNRPPEAQALLAEAQRLPERDLYMLGRAIAWDVESIATAEELDSDRPDEDELEDPDVPADVSTELAALRVAVDSLAATAGGALRELLDRTATDKCEGMGL